MTIFWFSLALVAIVALVGLAFITGFSRGEESRTNELHRVQMQAAQAERQLWDITRQAFVSMVSMTKERDRLRPERNRPRSNADFDFSGISDKDGKRG